MQEREREFLQMPISSPLVSYHGFRKENNFDHSLVCKSKEATRKAVLRAIDLISSLTIKQMVIKPYHWKEP